MSNINFQFKKLNLFFKRAKETKNKRVCPNFSDCQGKGNTAKRSKSKLRHSTEKNCPFVEIRRRNQPHYIAHNQLLMNLVEKRDQEINLKKYYEFSNQFFFQ